MYKIGEAIPDFKAEVFQNNEIKEVNFADYRGKWVVMLFYPADFTFVCPTELEDAAEFYGKFKDVNAEIISVSTDTAYVHKAWHDTSDAISKVEYPMMADPTGQICRDFGTYIDEAGLSLRGTFIIDPDGVLKAFDIHDNSIGRNIEEIFRKLQAAQYVAEHEGEVCPARWTPGKETLHPDVDLIGKI
jgi:peroxiredoxin (alkyl hydroperoxide reductase subunit C)